MNKRGATPEEVPTLSVQKYHDNGSLKLEWLEDKDMQLFEQYNKRLCGKFTLRDAPLPPSFFQTTFGVPCFV